MRTVSVPSAATSCPTEPTRERNRKLCYNSGTFGTMPTHHLESRAPVKERIQKLMSQLGIASRRNAEDMIEHGRVRINGKLAKLGDQADPDVDTLEVDGRRINLEAPAKIYIALHKPKNVVTTNASHRSDDRQTIRDLVPHEGHLFAIGRLDADSEGLIVLTNDGELAQKLSHPRYQHTKTYKVVVQGLPRDEVVQRWQRGVMLEEGTTSPASVRILKGAADQSTLRIVMTEGKKRQIRRVALLLGHPVKRLIRTRIGMLDIGTLKPGEWRELTPKDVSALSTPSPELKTIKQIAGKRKRYGDRPFDPEARPGRRARPMREETEPAPKRPPRGFLTDETSAEGYESDRKPMRRGPGKPSMPSDEAEKPARRGKPLSSADTSGGRRPRTGKADREETAKKDGRTGRPGKRRGRPAPNNPHARRHPKPGSKRSTKRGNES